MLTLKEVRDSAEFEEALIEFPGLDTVTDQDILRVIIGFALGHDFTEAKSRLFERDGNEIIKTLVQTHMHYLAAVLAEAQAKDAVLYAGLQSNCGTSTLIYI